VQVSLVLFDVLGRKVATIVDAMQQPGDYSVRLSSDALHSASGMYLYRLTAAGLSQTHRMALLK
jgi:hypothetical protein